MEDKQMKASDLSQGFVMEQIAILLADVAEAVAPLIEQTGQTPGLMGGLDSRQTARQTADGLRTKAAVLRQLFPEDSVAQAAKDRA